MSSKTPLLDTIASPADNAGQRPQQSLTYNPTNKVRLKKLNNVTVEETGYDKRFTADTDNPTIHAATGYPMCIPRAFPFGTAGDTDCRRTAPGDRGGPPRRPPVVTGHTDAEKAQGGPGSADGHCTSHAPPGRSTHAAPRRRTHRCRATAGPSERSHSP